MADFDNFVVAHPRYFEPMSRYEAGPEYADVVASLLPNDWESVRHDVWLGSGPKGQRTPDQGFKIHVSATLADSPTILGRVARVCFDSQTHFKVAADRRILGMLNAKRCRRGSAGKFMTIYPRDREHFVTLIDSVHEATRDHKGPYILSDRRYKDSNVVFYRYGGFVQRRRLLANGAHRMVMTGPDGSLVDDERTPFFSLPEGITDPFEPPVEEASSDAPPLLNNRFQIVEPLAFSNSGGVYIAIDKETEAKVVIKEARPYTHSWTDGTVALDAVSLLKREYETLDYLRDLGVFPKPIALFSEWEHWFLVQEFASGDLLKTYRTREDMLLMVHVGDAARMAKFARIFRSLAQQLITILEQVHERGMILGDVSPNNVLIDPDTLAIRLIDLESAFRLHEPTAFATFSRLWRTPGFREPTRTEARAALAPVDDWYALGMMLHGLIIPIEGLVELSPSSINRFLSRFVQAGLSPFIETTITSLLAGDVNRARQALVS